ncbi:MAG: Nif11-like leader peptide family RiPP precursor [Bacillota bacterium]
MGVMKELYLKVAADAMLQEKVGKIVEATGDDEAVAVEKLVGFAKEQGYDVTAEEVQVFFKTLSETFNEPLNDMELEAVAGGKIIPGTDGRLPMTAVTLVGAQIIGYGCNPLLSLFCGGRTFL